jgi:aminoglycoside phosphotransferase (APT) family kinase protein
VASLGELLVAHAERLVALGVTSDGRAVVVKVDRDLDGHRREAAVLARLAAAGVSVPAVVSTTVVDEPPAGVLVLERLPGEPLGQAGLEDERFGPGTWALVGEALARLHACPVAAPGPPMGGHTESTFAAHLGSWGAANRRHGRSEGWLTGAEADRHDALVGRLVELVAPRPEVLIHGDCSPQHWLVAVPEGPVGLIDLGDAGMGDPVYDLVVLTLTQPHHLPAVLDGYGADDDLRAHVAASAPGYRALRLAGEMAWLIDHGFDPSPTIPRVRAALR